MLNLILFIHSHAFFPARVDYDDSPISGEIVTQGKVSNGACIAEYNSMINCYPIDQVCVLITGIVFGIDGVSDVIVCSDFGSILIQENPTNYRFGEKDSFELTVLLTTTVFTSSYLTVKLISRPMVSLLTLQR